MGFGGSVLRNIGIWMDESTTYQPVGIILFSNPGAEIATRACLAARVAANCEAGRYGEMWLWQRRRENLGLVQDQ